MWSFILLFAFVLFGLWSIHNVSEEGFAKQTKWKRVKYRGSYKNRGPFRRQKHSFKDFKVSAKVSGSL